MNNKKIIYINYSPYENAGKILDYMLENFDYVFLYSLKFHDMRKKRKENQLMIYMNGKLIKKYSLFQLSVPQTLLFITLPIRSIITMVQIIYFSYILKHKYGAIEIFFSVNAFTSWIGILLKRIGLVNKTIFWVWDYYPPIHESWIIALARKLYFYFDKWATFSSDKVIFINRKLLKKRQSIGIVSKKNKPMIVSLGTDIFNTKLQNKQFITFGFIGVLKKSMGLDAIFDNAEEIINNFPEAKFEIIGSGPDEQYFKERAKNDVLPVNFYGYVEENSFNEILSKCSIGIALYQPDSGNVSNYGDAGKVKRYLSLGLPVIVTDIFELAKEVEKSNAGIIVRYGNSQDLIAAIKKIMSRYKTYQKNALSLSKMFYYKNIYPEVFKF